MSTNTANTPPEHQESPRRRGSFFKRIGKAWVKTHHPERSGSSGYKVVDKDDRIIMENGNLLVNYEQRTILTESPRISDECTYKKGSGYSLSTSSKRVSSSSSSSSSSVNIPAGNSEQATKGQRVVLTASPTASPELIQRKSTPSKRSATGPSRLSNMYQPGEDNKGKGENRQNR
ncbi:hypothetical protein BDF22DRAFT_741411 [Syncephalis plumigaleata]|nr:hypothetical protein BDF22DRAFT_741411 [Syncephalis plumigaleata]